MFRKLKKKEDKNVRQRIQEDDEYKQDVMEQIEETSTIADSYSKAPTLLSFDHEEGTDVNFTLKKSNTKRVNEIKRLVKMEVEAGNFLEREDQNMEEEQEIKPKERNARDQYLDKYRNEQEREAKTLQSDESEVEILEESTDDVHIKFSNSFAGIPDSRAIYEAKKKREQMKSGGYIPLSEKNNDKQQGPCKRLVREGDSDDEEEHGKFYSAKELQRDEDERRREEQNEFLEHEQGDTENDPEMDEWERQQIEKAVGRYTIDQIQTEFDLTKTRNLNDSPIDMDMDVEIDFEKIANKTRLGPMTTGGVITLDDILAKLKLRIGDHNEALNQRKLEIDKMERNLEENKKIIIKIETDEPGMAERFSMYQEMRSYIRCLLDCLNEKVSEIDSIADKRRLMSKAKTERLVRRRRQDIRDQYAECSFAASGKTNLKSSETAVRTADREARRAARRRTRETNLANIQHEEGLSSDDGGEPKSDMIIESETIKESNIALSQVFIDAQDEYSSFKKVLDRIIDWYAMDKKSFEDAWVHLCIPKLSSPYVRIELIEADILKNETFKISNLKWFNEAISAGICRSDFHEESDIIVGIIPSIIEKVVLPFFIDLVNDEWDPLSLRQSTNLGRLLCELSIFPSMTSTSKSLNLLIQAFKTKITNSIDEDLYTPMFSKAAIENPNTGCKSFLDRQFWSAIKLIRCINKFSGFISTEMRFELIVENIINKVCVVAIQLGTTNDISCEKKICALMDELDSELCKVAKENSFRSLSACLSKVAEDMKEAKRDFYKEICKEAKKYCMTIKP